MKYLKVNRFLKGDIMKFVKYNLLKGLLQSKITIVLLLCIFIMTAGIIHAAPPAKKFGPAKPKFKVKAKQVPKSAVQSFKPDLIVSKVELTRDCMVKFTIKNHSKGKIANQLHIKGSVKIRVTGKPSKIYNIPFRQLDVRGLLKKAGGQVTYVTENKISKTTYVQVDVDPKHLIPESNETNNSSGRVQLKSKCLMKTAKPFVRIVLKPDLIVESLTRSIKNPTTDDRITITTVVRNQGPAGSDPCRLSIKVGGDSVIPTYAVPALRSGARHTIRRSMTIPEAQIYLTTVRVDTDNKINEEDETNNKAEMIFEVSNPPKPDLVVESLTRSIENPTTEDEITITTVVRNQGLAGSGPCRLSIKVGGDSVVPTYEVPALRGGATHTIRRSMTIPEVQIYLTTVRIDTDNQVNEEDEANNKAEMIFEVSNPPKPDLVVESLTRSIENPTTKDEITITAVVRNQGPAASDPCRLSIKVGGDSVVPTYDVPALRSGATHTIRRSMTIPEVQIYLTTVRVDTDNQVNEKDETNNKAEMIFRVE